MPSTDYIDAVEELESRGSNRENPSLDPVIEALEELGRPNNDYTVILVGGTNGKGSTVEMISSCLQELGYDVGAYNSPHLVSIRERIKYNDRMIEKEEFERLYEKINSLETDLTFFEFMTVMAYKHFSIHRVDYAVMEVGMGGTFDATNAAEPELSVITNVEHDHTEYLGETRNEIAEEKAAITPWNGTLVVSDRMRPVLEVAEERSSEVVDPLTVKQFGDKYSVRDQEFSLPVEGSFQQENLAVALRAVEELDELPDLSEAFSDLEFPARMETVSRNPRWIIDGAHNPAALRKILPDLPEEFACVFSALDSKPIKEMIRILEEKANKFYLTESGFQRAANPEEIAEHVSIEKEVMEDPGEAVKEALNSENTVVVTGSLYLAGDVKKELNS